jgi:hypothetical protein
VPEEGLEEFGPQGQPTSFLADVVVGLVHGVGREVGQVPVLEIGLRLFRGIETGGVRREPGDRPARVDGDILADVVVSMRSPRIPQGDQGPPLMLVDRR